MVNYFNYNENRSIYAKYVSLESNYKKEDEFNDVDIKNYIEANKEDLKIDFIDVKYAKLTPEILTGSSEYNENYYEIIDEIENKILSQKNLEGLLSEYKGVKINDLKELSQKNVDKDLQDIFNYKESDLVQILDKEDYFLVFRNTNYRKKVPTLDEKFSTEIKEILYKENRYNYNQKLFSKINSDKFSDDDFNNSVKNKDEYKEILIKSIKDNNTFEINSVELIYSMPINSFVLVTDDKEKVYLVKILGVKNNDFNSGDKEMFLKTKDKIMNEIYSSYDQFLNQNYKVEINYNALERTENYFK